MKYQDIRNQIHTGDLLFWSHGSWRNLHDIEVMMVRAFTMSEYSHVGMAWVVNGRVFVLHAIGRGVLIEPLSIQGDFYLMQIPNAICFDDAALDRVFSRIGESYSKWEAIKGFFGKVVPGADHEWQCAEFVTWAYEQIGVSLTDDITPTGVAKAGFAMGCSMLLVTNPGSN